MEKKNDKIILGKGLLDYILESSDVKTKMVDLVTVRYLLRAMMAGIIVAFGYVTYILIDANFNGIILGGGSTLKPLGHFFSGWVFGFCLIFIYYVRAELLTSNMMVMTVAKYNNKISYAKAGKVMLMCYIGNLLGGLFVGLLLVNSTMVTGTAGAVEYMNHVLAVKQGFISDAFSSGSFNFAPLWDLFVRAIFCNFFINLAMIQVYSGNIKSDGTKSLVMFGGVFFFMYLGLEHSVANTVFFAVAAFTPGAEFDLMLATINILIVLIGNFIGGGVLIGLYSAFVNDAKQLDHKGQNID